MDPQDNRPETEGQNPWQHRYTPPKSFDGPGILKLQTTSNTNGTKVIGAFDAYVVDN